MEIKAYSFDTGPVSINYAEVAAAGAPLVLLHSSNTRSWLRPNIRKESAP